MRRLDNHTAVVAPSTLVAVLTCPAGHKYEVVDISVSDDAVASYRWLFILGRGGGTFPLDEVEVGPPAFFNHHQYAGLVLHASDILYVLAATTSATPVGIVVGYVDVTPV